jgi:hypothetical protein
VAIPLRFPADSPGSIIVRIESKRRVEKRREEKRRKRKERINLILWILYQRGKNPLCPLDRRLGGTHNRSGRRGEQKNLALSGSRTQTARQLSPQPVAIPLRFPADSPSSIIVRIESKRREGKGREEKKRKEKKRKEKSGEETSFRNLVL